MPLDDFFAWARQVVGDVGPEAGLGEAETEAGWPMFLVRTEDGSLAAVYRFQEYAAAVIVHISLAPLTGEALDRMVALLKRARPDWREDEAVSLAEMWDP